MKKIYSLLLVFYCIPFFSQCLVGDCENGEGTYVYTDKTKIVGFWKNSKPNGQCQVFYADGGSYTGNLHEGKWNGLGKYISNENVIIEGNFIDGNLNGK